VLDFTDTTGPILALLGGPRAMALRITPYHAFEKEVVRTVVAALENGRSTDSPLLSSLSGAGLVEELEARFKSYLGVRYALALSSGTAALHTALAACHVRRGQEVILSPYDWGAGVAAVLAGGARPIFADIDPLTYTLDPTSVERRISDRTSAIVVTHIFGHPADMEAICAIARARELRVIEDCAQALGACYQGHPVGTCGDVGCFSLGWGKAVNAGEGGVLVTNSDDVFENAVRFSQHPLRQEKEGVEPTCFSLNYRIHPLGALLGSVQMEELDDRLRERRQRAERLSVLLKKTPGIRPVFVAQGCTHAFHRYSPSYIASDWDDLPRDVIVAALAAEGVPISEGLVRVPLSLRLRGERQFARRKIGTEACPLAEERCAHQELGVACSPAPTTDFSLWLDQLGEAIHKVHEQRWFLREAAVVCPVEDTCWHQSKRALQASV
jgi:perosamine synthetase